MRVDREPGALTLSEEDRRVLAPWPPTAPTGRSPSARAHEAARDVGDPAAVAAARAAGHAAGTAHMAAHARGAAAYAAVAAGLAAPDDPTAAAVELRWALSHASSAVRNVLRMLSAPTRAAGLLGMLIGDLRG